MARPRAFTLIELLVVISIISLLASVVLASLNSARDKARIGAGRQFEANMYHAEADQAVGIWDFDECSGVPKDRAVISPDMTAVGTTTWSSSTPSGTGCSMLFSGTNYVKTPITAGGPLDISGDVTLSAWIYPTSNAAVGNIVRAGQFTDEQYSLFYDVNGTLRFQWYNASFRSSASPSNVVPTNKWTHVAAVRASGTFSFYVNGALVGTAAAGVPTNTPAYLEMGMYGDGSGGGFIGNIDNVRIYSKAFTASDVQRLYALEASRHAVATK